MVVGGVDVGSTQTKAVLMDEDRRIVGRALIDTGAHVVRAAERSFEAAIEAAGLEAHDVGHVIGTGYGRYKVTFGDDQVTEISCHAKGAKFVYPGTRTVLDIGGQDTKAIRIDENGDVADFCMNDKCAAGTGRFLSAAAEVMELGIDEIGPLSLEARIPIKISNVCTVFVETEILSHLARGRKIPDVLAGVHRAIARRAVGLLRRVGLESEYTFTGGVSRNPGMRQALAERLGEEMNASEESHYMGAIGAALFAWERVHGSAPAELAT
jgi:predicted CoA-substrate-specific enzyme activase